MKRIVLEELGLSMEAPDNVKVRESVYGEWAYLEAPGFVVALNAFVPEGSAQTADEARRRISNMCITYEETSDNEWRFDVEHDDGTVGTLMRIREPRMLDIDTAGTPAERDAVLAAIKTLRWL